MCALFAFCDGVGVRTECQVQIWTPCLAVNYGRRGGGNSWTEGEGQKIKTELWQVLCGVCVQTVEGGAIFLSGSRCPTRTLPIKIQSVHPPVRGTCALNSPKAETPPSRMAEAEGCQKHNGASWNGCRQRGMKWSAQSGYLLHSEAQINFTHA